MNNEKSPQTGRRAAEPPEKALFTLGGPDGKKSDLNFLYVLEAMLDTGSVSSAAERIGISQPAMSHALARLRKRFGDPLFVKTGAGMRPTPAAERLGASAKKALAIVRAEIASSSTFDPASTRRVFTLGMSDLAAAALLPRIVAEVSKCAPNARLTVLNPKDQDVANLLEEGKVDIVLGVYRYPMPSLMQQAVYKTTPYLCIARNGHPAISGKISLAQFAATPHVVSTQSTSAHGFIDRTLATKGLSRQIALEVPYLLTVPSVILASDYIAVVPAALTGLFAQVGLLQLLASPITPPRQIIKQYWHRRFTQDPANQWLRGLLSAALKE